jgi:hypothetical protein
MLPAPNLVLAQFEYVRPYRSDPRLPNDRRIVALGACGADQGWERAMWQPKQVLATTIVNELLRLPEQQRDRPTAPSSRPLARRRLAQRRAYPPNQPGTCQHNQAGLRITGRFSYQRWPIDNHFDIFRNRLPLLNEDPTAIRGDVVQARIKG